MQPTDEYTPDAMYAYAPDADEPFEAEPTAAAPVEPASQTRTVILVDPHLLKPHPRNREVYGNQPPPNDLLDSIERGWSASSILEALPDGTLIKGHLRRYAAIQLHIPQVPVVYRDDLTDDEEQQVDELLRDNAGRVKTREVVCREWRLAWNTFRAEQGSVAGQKTRDVLGKRFGVSGVTLEHGVYVVNALDRSGLDYEVRGKVREALEQRGVEPAWKLLRRGQNAQAGTQDEAQTPEGEGAVALAISPARRHKALMDIIGAVDDRLPVLAEPESLTAAIPQEDLDDVLSAVQNVVNVLGLIEAEIRDRLEIGSRKPRRKKSGA